MMIILIVFSVALVTYFFIGMAASFVIPSSYYWIRFFISLIFAFGVGWLAWNKLNTTDERATSNIVFGAVILGGTGVAFAVFGPLLINPRNEQAILGILFFGPPGVVAGAILGAIVGKRKSKAWNALLSVCAIASVAVVVCTQMYLTSYESKNSSIIHDVADIQKRDDTLRYLHVRSLSDDEVIKLIRFKNLFGLDFEAGWAAYEAKITDNGLKNILEMNLPHLGALKLNHCSKITDEGMKHIAGIQTLKVVGLADCPQITDKGLYYLAKSRSIETIDLRNCTGITDVGLGHLGIMPKLKRVNLGGCTNITTRGIEDLRKLLSNIIIDT